MVDAIDAWVDVIFFAVAIQPLRRRPLRSLNFPPSNFSSAGAVAEEAVIFAGLKIPGHFAWP